MKTLVNPDGTLTDDATKLVEEILSVYTPLFRHYMKEGYNVFEILGVLTSALINAQKQAWIDEKMS